MDDSIGKAKEVMERRRRSERRQRLFHLLELILEGKIDSSKTPLAKIFEPNPLQGTRQRYVSPKDRSTHNYGYMETDEMLAGTPFYGEL
jgi:hypothetical protein